MTNILHSHYVMNTLIFFVMFDAALGLANRADCATSEAIAKLDNSLSMDSAVIIFFFSMSIFDKKTHVQFNLFQNKMKKEC